MRLPAVIDQRAGGTALWMAIFLAVALLLVVAGLVGLAFVAPLG